MKQNYLSHVAYSTNNVIAAMERVMENVKPGIINPNGALGLVHVPDDHGRPGALGDPLEDFWVQGATPLSASASASRPRATHRSPHFTGSATGGTAPYTYSWNFGDGSARAAPRTRATPIRRPGPSPRPSP